MERHYAIFYGKNLAFFLPKIGYPKMAAVFKGKARAETYAASMTKKHKKTYRVELVRVSTYRKA